MYVYISVINILTWQSNHEINIRKQTKFSIKHHKNRSPVTR